MSDTIALPDGLSPVQVADEPAELSHELGRGALAVTVEPTAGFVLTLLTCHLKSKLLSFPNGRFQAKDEGERARYGAYALNRRAAEAAAVRELATELLKAGDSERVIVLGDLNDKPSAATTQILNGPPGSEIGTSGFAQPDKGDRWRLWNLAPCIPEEQRFSRKYRGRGELIDHMFVSHTLLDPLPEVRTVIEQSLPSMTDEPVLAENYVRAGQAAWWYSLGMPPSRCRRRMSRSLIWAWLVIGGGSGCSGRALAISRAVNRVSPVLHAYWRSVATP